MNQTALTKIRTPEDHWLAIRKNWTPIENLLKQLEGTGEKDDSSHQQIVSLKAKERIDRNLSNLLHEIKNQRNSVVHEDVPLPDKDAWVRNSEHAFQQLLRLLRPTEAPARNHLTEEDTQVALTTPASASHSTLEPAKSFQLHAEAPQITPRDLQICLAVHFVAAQLLWPLVLIASYLNRHQTTAVSPIISDLSRGFTWAVHQFQSVAHITFPAPAMLFVLSLALLLLNVSQRMRLWINAYKVFIAILGSQLILSYANKWIT